MATTVTSSIGTASRDYSTISAWEAAAPANLVSADEIWRGECYNDATFNETVVIGGSTSSGTCYKELTAAAGQSFADSPSNALRYNAANGATIFSSGGYVTALTITEANAKVSRLQIAVTASSSGALLSTGASVDINRCVIEGSHAQGTTDAAVQIQSSGVIRNSLVRSTSASWSGVVLIDGASAYNTTVYSTSNATVRGIDFNYANGVVQNCAQFGFALASKSPNSSGVTITTSYTDVASPSGGWSGGVAFSTATFGSVTAGSENLKLVSGSALLDVGTTDATNAAADIFGTARPVGSAYDVGAFEFSAPNSALKDDDRKAVKVNRSRWAKPNKVYAEELAFSAPAPTLVDEYDTSLGRRSFARRRCISREEEFSIAAAPQFSLVDEYVRKPPKLRNDHKVILYVDGDNDLPKWFSLVDEYNAIRQNRRYARNIGPVSNDVDLPIDAAPQFSLTDDYAIKRRKRRDGRNTVIYAEADFELPIQPFQPFVPVDEYSKARNRQAYSRRLLTTAHEEAPFEAPPVEPMIVDEYKFVLTRPRDYRYRREQRAYVNEFIPSAPVAPSPAEGNPSSYFQNNVGTFMGNG